VGVVLTDGERERLRKLVGMLGSNADGEKLAALHMIEKLAQTKGLKIHELLLGETDPPPPQIIFADMRNKPKPHWGWQEKLGWVLEMAEEDDYLLSDWELGFCHDFVRRGFRAPTAKQLPIMLRIFARAVNRYG
jgi:hypothetical protein